MPYCKTHNHIYRQSCKECYTPEMRAENAKRGYVRSNPYSAGSKAIKLPKHDIPSEEELRAIPRAEWGEREYLAFRVYRASGTPWNNGCETGN